MVTGKAGHFLSPTDVNHGSSLCDLGVDIIIQVFPLSPVDMFTYMCMGMTEEKIHVISVGNQK